MNITTIQRIISLLLMIIITLSGILLIDLSSLTGDIGITTTTSVNQENEPIVTEPTTSVATTKKGEKDEETETTDEEELTEEDLTGEEQTGEEGLTGDEELTSEDATGEGETGDENTTETTTRTIYFNIDDYFDIG